MEIQLLNETLDAIEWNEFHWDQGQWVSSDVVESGVSVERFNECHTSFCFAGHVASRNRELLYENADDGFEATEYFIADEDDSVTYTMPSQGAYTTLYRAVKEDGVVTFEPYFGQIISARTAAILDLEISSGVASILFDGDNSLEYIRGVVNALSEV
jgi:hypothetical protein